MAKMSYANHAAISPWPASAAEAVRRFAAENAASGPGDYAAWLGREQALRERSARLLGAPGQESIALLSNTSQGIGIVAGGLDWARGDNVVTAAGEFVTNRLPWEALEARGVELRRVALREAADPEAALLERLDARSRVLAVSAVQWDDGFRLDLARLGPACRANGTLFLVDAIQQVGALRLDVQAASIDCLAAGSHKWQMGPEGMGLFYCTHALRRRLRLDRLGWHMLEDPFRFERPGRAVVETGRRFEPGSPNNLGQAALHAALGLLEEHTMEQVEADVLDNTDRLLRAIGDIAGLELSSDPHPARRSGIVACHAPGRSLPAFNRALQARGVVCALRGDALRISPHFYQRGPALDRILNALEDAAGAVV